MSNSKISALTSATTPLAGTETLPIVQSGATKQVSVANLTAGRAVSAASLTLTTALAATSGGTGSTSAFVANAIAYATSTTVLSTSSNWTYDGTNAILLGGRFGVGTSSPGSYTSTTSPSLVVVSAATPTDLANGVIAAWDGTTGGAANVGGIYTMGGNDGVTAFRAFASIKGAKENATSGNYASYLAFGTRANGGSMTERFRVDSSGNTLNTSTGGLGYGTGSGGTVTQTTSRTTGVTLNKTNGAITLVSAAGLATYQSFTVTNSTVAATDVIHVCQKSGTDKYIILVTAVAAGSFQITFATTGGVTTEQPVFNFAVIKAVTA